jgi:hypothetical protein
LARDLPHRDQRNPRPGVRQERLFPGGAAVNAQCSPPSLSCERMPRTHQRWTLRSPSAGTATAHRCRSSGCALAQVVFPRTLEDLAPTVPQSQSLVL